MKKFLIVLLVIVLLAVIGLESYLLFFRDRLGASAGTPPANATVTQSPFITPPPVPSEAPVTPEPVPTAPPATAAPVTPEPTATPIPAPTAAPATPTPMPSDGSFSSDTGTNLNLLVSWRAEDLGNGNSRVYVEGKVRSYSLNVVGTSVSISFGGRSTTASGTPIVLADDAPLTETTLFSTSLDVPSGTVGTMSVDWAYKGTYSGVSLPTITATGQVSA